MEKNGYNLKVTSETLYQSVFGDPVFNKISDL